MAWSYEKCFKIYHPNKIHATTVTIRTVAQFKPIGVFSTNNNKTNPGIPALAGSDPFAGFKTLDTHALEHNPLCQSHPTPVPLSPRPFQFLPLVTVNYFVSHLT